MISKHRLDNDHEIKWDKVKILDVEPNYYKRKYSEMVRIKSTENTLNIQHDTGSIISNVYNPVSSLEISKNNRKESTKKKKRKKP